MLTPSPALSVADGGYGIPLRESNTACLIACQHLLPSIREALHFVGAGVRAKVAEEVPNPKRSQSGAAERLMASSEVFTALEA